MLAETSGGVAGSESEAWNTADLWVAALVLQHGLVLHARDRHFDRLAQIIRA